VTGVSLPVQTNSPAAVQFVPGTELVMEPDGFSGGWTILQRTCEACVTRPCAKHLQIIQRAYARRAATVSARPDAAEEGNVVAAAEEIAVSAAGSLVSAP